MGYLRTFWADHVLSLQNRFKVVKNESDNNYTITPAGEVVQRGTPQNAEHFNNMEEGICDAHLASVLTLIGMRQNRIDVEHGTVQLTNSSEYPFNNSRKSVSLSASRNSNDYIVVTEVVSAAGNVGEIVVSEKLKNGFKLEFTGSAISVTVNYTVIGRYFE